MKKRILGAVAVIAIVAMAAFNMNVSADNSDFSALTLSNVEALASGEADSKKYKCYSILDGSGQSISCSTCQMASGTPPWYHFGNYCTR